MNTEFQKGKDYNYRRDYKKTSYGTVSLIVIGIILSIWLIIFFRELILSFKVYKLELGISDSPWVGLASYKTLFENTHFKMVIKNTFIFNLLFSVIAFVLAVIVGRIITHLPNRSILKDMIAVLFALPLFMPSEVYAEWFINILGSKVLINTLAMRFIHPLMAGIKYMGVPIIIIYILHEINEERDSMLEVKAAALFSLVSLAFIANSSYSLTKAIYNSLVNESVDMMDTFVFRSSIRENNMAMYAVNGVVQTLITFILFALLFIPIKHLFLATFKKNEKKSQQENLRKKIISSLLALIIFSVIYFLPYIANGEPFDMGFVKNIISLAWTSTFVTVFLSALIATIFGVVIGLGLVNYNNKIKVAVMILLLIVTVFAAKPINISQYIMIKDMRLVNTVYAIILTSCFSAPAVWAMGSILRSEEYISVKFIFLAATGIFLIQAALIYCNSTPGNLYLSDVKLRTPVMVYRAIVTGPLFTQELKENSGSTNGIGIMGFFVSLPSILLFLTCRIVLPKKQLISIMCGGMKN